MSFFGLFLFCIIFVICLLKKSNFVLSFIFSGLSLPILLLNIFLDKSFDSSFSFNILGGKSSKFLFELNLTPLFSISIVLLFLINFVKSIFLSDLNKSDLLLVNIDEISNSLPILKFSFKLL